MENTIIHQKGDTYAVSGFYAYSSRRFRTMHFESPHMALGINLWKGSVYQIRDGKRKLIRRIY